MSIPPAWPQVLNFFGMPLVIEPSPGQLSGDAGLLPVRQFDERIGLTRSFADALDDPRDPQRSWRWWPAPGCRGSGARRPSPSSSPSTAGGAEGQFTEGNADVLQPFDQTGHVRPGPSEVAVEVRGETGLWYPVVGRHFEPHRVGPQERPVPEVAMGCDRTRPATADVLRAKAAVRYNGKVSTYVVRVALGPSPSAPTPPPAARR